MKAKFVEEHIKKGIDNLIWLLTLYPNGKTLCSDNGNT